MIIRGLTEGDEELLEQFLFEHAETSMFLRSNLKASGLTYQDKSFHGEYLGAFSDDNKIIGVFAHYWNGNLMMQASSQDVLESLVKVFKENVSRQVAGVLGPSNQAQVTIDLLEIPKKSFAINREEGLFCLNLDRLILQVNHDKKISDITAAKELDKATLFDWLKSYRIEALGATESEALNKEISLDVDSTKLGNDRWALTVDGLPRCLVGFNAKLPDIVQIGPVWTPVEYRNKGYARQLLSMVLQEAQKKKVQKAILFTDNPAAIKVYEALGFTLIDNYRLALLNEKIQIK